MTARRFEISEMRHTLALMSNDERATTIVEMFKIAAAEFAALVLEHTHTETGHPLPGDEDNPIRDRLRELPVEHRAEFLGSLFEAVCEEFARLLTERPQH